MLFGSILSGTDPVAVVALLKDVNTSPRLFLLIIGESLSAERWHLDRHGHALALLRASRRKDLRPKRHLIWELLEWFGNTMIFFLAGVVYGGKAVHYSVTGDDFALLILIYVMLIPESRHNRLSLSLHQRHRPQVQSPGDHLHVLERTPWSPRDGSRTGGVW
jgi:hypothetical protein